MHAPLTQVADLSHRHVSPQAGEALLESSSSEPAVMLASADDFANCRDTKLVTEGVDRPLPVGSGERDTGTARAVLQGPFRVYCLDGTDITPGSMLRQAILAVLIIAPRQILSRNSLQDLFWGDGPASRASASLRTALYLLRSDLAALGPDILRADRQTVSLAPGRLVADGGTAGGAEFLTGMDLQLQGCSAFEDWLRDMRLTEGAPPPPGPSRACAPVPTLAGQPRIALGLLPPLHAGLGPVDVHCAEAFVDNVVLYVTQTTTLDIHDLRSLDRQIVPLPIASGKGATHWLQASVERRPSGICLRLRLIEGSTRKLVWLSDTVQSGAEHSDDIAYALGELIVDRLSSLNARADLPDLFPVSALAAMFSLDAPTILRTEVQLDRMLSEGGPFVLECLRVFAQVFKVHEGIGPSAGFDVTALCERLSSMPTSDPLLPLCQSLLGYALHMLTDDSETAYLLVEAACVRSPQLAITLDHLAVLRLIRGDTEGAADALQKCLRAGAFSPWRYTYDVTGAMVCMAKGDFRQSLYHANQALFRKPKYLGALRYSMAGLALAGKAPDARRMMSRIQDLRPDYDLSHWAEGLLRRAPTHLSKSMVQGLQASAIL